MDERGKVVWARTIVRLVAFNKAPSVHVDDLTPGAVVAAQHIIPAHPLSETFANLPGPHLLLVVQARDKAA